MEKQECREELWPWVSVDSSSVTIIESSGTIIELVEG